MSKKKEITKTVRIKVDDKHKAEELVLALTFVGIKTWVEERQISLYYDISVYFEQKEMV